MKVEADGKDTKVSVSTAKRSSTEWTEISEANSAVLKGQYTVFPLPGRLSVCVCVLCRLSWLVSMKYCEVNIGLLYFKEI